MFIFEARNIVLQVHVIKKRCWDLQYLPFLQTFSYALFSAICILFFLDWSHRSGIHLSLIRFLLVDSTVFYLNPEIILFQVSLKQFFACEFLVNLIHYRLRT